MNFFFLFPSDAAAAQRTAIMYSGRSVVGVAWLIDGEITPIPLLIFTGGGSKSAKFGLIFDITTAVTTEQPITMVGSGLELRMGLMIFSRLSSRDQGRKLSGNMQRERISYTRYF